MTTNELEGRALAEAAARAMGWTQVRNQGAAGGIFWCPPGGCVSDWEQHAPEFTERECLAWLHERRKNPTVHATIEKGWCRARIQTADCGNPGYVAEQGRDLLEALQRLVVAVAAREQAAKENQ